MSFDDVPHWIERLRRPEPIVVEDAGACDRAVGGREASIDGCRGRHDGGRRCRRVASSSAWSACRWRRAPRTWTDDEVTFLRMVAETISHVLERSPSRCCVAFERGAVPPAVGDRRRRRHPVDGLGVITYVSPSSTALVGKRTRRAGGVRVDLDGPPRRSRRSAEGGTSCCEHQGSFSSEMRLLPCRRQRGVGGQLDLDGASTPETGETVEYRTSVRDITDRKRLEAELERQALHDPLTGLGQPDPAAEPARGRHGAPGDRQRRRGAAGRSRRVQGRERHVGARRRRRGAAGGGDPAARARTTVRHGRPHRWRRVRAAVPRHRSRAGSCQHRPAHRRRHRGADLRRRGDRAAWVPASGVAHHRRRPRPTPTRC